MRFNVELHNAQQDVLANYQVSLSIVLIQIPPSMYGLITFASDKKAAVRIAD